jgi:Fur family peroxide stress response transcriptional regulator
MSAPPIRYHRSSQREAILGLVRQTKSHPTAEAIYAKLKHRFPRLSLGTVYRNLHILVQQGMIREVRFGSGRDRYDGHLEPHYHFVCRRCEELIDLDMPIRDDLEAAAARMGRFKIEEHSIVFQGLCASCRQIELRQSGA